jgi:hypothetical protein
MVGGQTAVNQDTERFFSDVLLWSSVLRDRCHQVINSGEPEFQGPLNRVWSALDLLDLAVHSAKNDMLTKESINDPQVRRGGTQT